MSRSIVQMHAVLDAVGGRYSRALDAKPSKGDFSPRGIDALTDSVCDVPPLVAVAKAALDVADAYAGTPMGDELHAAIDDALGEVAS